jgi:Protein of unknown function (DUF3223)
MGKARKIQIGDRLFEKAGDGTAFFSKMLNGYAIGNVVSVSDGNELSALLERHDEKDEKVGVGIDHFEVGAAQDGFGGKCFWIVRSDGSRIDFSFKHCLEPKSYD